LERIKNKLDLKNEVDPNGGNTREKYANEIQYKLREEEIRTKIQEGAIVAKKAAEQFITSLASELADTVIFVVNELTWFDQQAIESLSKQYPSVIVVHNFKATGDKANYLALRKKYVETIYPGAMNKVTLPGTEIQVEYWQNNSGSLSHFFLCREGSEAGVEVNQGTFHQITSLLNANVKPSRNHPIVDIIRTSSLMMENYFRGPIHDVAVRYNKNTFEISLVASTKARDPQDAFTMTRSQVEYDGLNLGITSGDFKPLIDVIQLDECIVLKADIPDLLSNSKAKTYTDHDEDDQHYCEVFIDDEDRLVIEGKRSTFFLAYNSEGKPTNQCFGYNKTDGLGRRLIIAERKSGKFQRFVKIPKGFSNREDDLDIHFAEGTLQVRIPRRERTTRRVRA